MAALKINTQKFKLTGFLAAFFIVFVLVLTQGVFALNPDPGGNGGSGNASGTGGTSGTSGASSSGVPSDNPIVKDINMIVNFLAGLVGVVVVGSIIYGGIQYIMAGDNPQAVSAAKDRITNSLIALVAFGFMYAFLQWLVPGGVEFF